MTIPETADNPLLQVEGTPSFDDIQPEHVEPAVRQVLSQSGRQLEALEARLTADAIPTWDTTLVPLEAIGQTWEQTCRQSHICWV